MMMVHTLVFGAFLWTLESILATTVCPNTYYTRQVCVCDYMTHRASCENFVLPSPYIMPAVPSYVTDIKIYNGFFPNLTKISFQLISRNHITYLEITWSHIRHVDPDTFEGFVNLTALNLRGNKIDTKSMKHSLANVKDGRLNRLSFKNMGWTDMSINMFSGAPRSIRHVDISYNKQIKLSDHMFDGLEKTSTLIFTYSNLLKCGNSFKQLKSLLNLDLSFNEIGVCNAHILPITLKQLNIE